MRKLQRLRQQRRYRAIEAEHAQFESAWQRRARDAMSAAPDLRSPVEIARAANAALHPATS
jgi:hypothetical protein